MQIAILKYDVDVKERDRFRGDRRCELDCWVERFYMVKKQVEIVKAVGPQKENVVYEPLPEVS